MNVIDVRGVSFSYMEGTPPVLNNIDLQIKEGEFVAVLGHNGSGKSTLAKLLNGILTPTEGTVIVEGMDTSDEQYFYDIRRKVVYCPQTDHLQIPEVIYDVRL